MEIEIGKKPAAWIPAVMSVCAIFLVGLQLATHGMKPQPDEGAIGHLWQLLIVAQLPVIALFAYRWLRRAPRQALTILAAQVLALATAALPVFVFGW